MYMSKEKNILKMLFLESTGTLDTKLSLRYSLWKRDPTNDLRVIQILFISTRRTICAKWFGSSFNSKSQQKIIYLIK